VCWKETVDLDQSFTSHGLFTTVVQLPYGTDPGTSLFGQNGTTSGHTGVVQPGATTSKMENPSILNAEEGITEK
jgi:hypothetical protein